MVVTALPVSGITSSVSKAAESDTTPVYVLYDANRGEHFFTANESEKDNLLAIGWKEGNVAWTSPKTSNTPVYVLYNPNDGGDHYYTANEKEKDGLLAIGWTEGDIKFYSDDAKSVLVNTLYNPNEIARNHHYTVSTVEKESLLAAGWQDHTNAATAIYGVEGGDALEIKEAEATKVDTIEVTFASPVDTANTEVTVAKGTLSVPATVTWNADKTVATITTAAKMTNGTYEVTAENTKTKKKVSKDVEIVDQYVAEIVITNDIALTNAANKSIAYAYYDVLDQYGESMRASTSISWSGSCTITGKKTTGQLTLKKTTGDWVYNDQIFVTGVYTKTGVTVQKTLTVGGEQALDSIEMKGFVKKDTSEIIQSLPAGFKSGEYYMIYNVLDQNGDALDIGAARNGAVTFVSDNVLVVKEIGAAITNGLTIEGNEYEASLVEPGIKVSDGGEVTVTGIATKTGNKSTITFNVGETPVITKFTFGSPSGVVADGDKNVEIPFTATAADGTEITDFDTIAKQKTFNELTLSASEGDLVLKEQNDGSAKLYWSDSSDYVGDNKWPAGCFDGIDRPISLTAVVVGGESDNEMLSVSDKRRPDAIAAVNADEVYVEGAEISFTLASFKYYDQYGKVIGSSYGEDNGFFAKAATTGLTSPDTELNGYTFGVRVKYAGSGKIVGDSVVSTVYVDNTSIDTDTKEAIIVYNSTIDTSKITFKTKTDITSVATGEGFKFEIAKTNVSGNRADGKASDWETASTTKFAGMTVVDIEQVKNLTISDLNMFYTGVLKNASSTELTKPGMIETTVFSNTPASATGGLTDTATYKQRVVVKGTYNGKSVTVPVGSGTTGYYTVAGSKLSTNTDTDGVIDTINFSNLKMTDLYDATSAKNTSKIASDTLKATVGKPYGETKDQVTFYISAAGTGATADTLTSYTESTAATEIVAAGSSMSDLKTALDAANTEVDALEGTDLKNAGFNDISSNAAEIAKVKAAIKAENQKLFDAQYIFDTATKTVSISDQAPEAASIVGVAESYVLNPTNTEINNGTADGVKTILETYNVGVAKLMGTYLGSDAYYAIGLVDQYGAPVAGDITVRATNLTENASGVKSNNLKVSGNDSTSCAVSGAERGDTFDLVLAYGNITKTTKITVGSDILAALTSTANTYRDALLVTLQ